VAKQLRFTVTLALLAREINKYIFQPTYILSEGSHIRELLVDMAKKNSKRESFCRGMLLSTNPDAETKNLQGKIKKVVENVASYYNGLLPDTQLQEFRQSLTAVVQKAAEFWKTVRYTEKKYEPDFDPIEGDDFDWEPLPLYDDGDLGNDESAEDNPLDEDQLIVFPRICWVYNNNPDPLYSWVVALKKSHWALAEREQRKREPLSPTNGKAPPSVRQRSRRTSLPSGNVSNAQSGSFLATGEPAKVQSTV
jgi:hypothetical protein